MRKVFALPHASELLTALRVALRFESGASLDARHLFPYLRDLARARAGRGRQGQRPRFARDGAQPAPLRRLLAPDVVAELVPAGRHQEAFQRRLVGELVGPGPDGPDDL